MALYRLRLGGARQSRPRHRLFDARRRVGCQPRHLRGSFGRPSLLHASWGDSAGGLAVFDPQTSVLTSRFASDGLATDKLASVEAVDRRLRISYLVEFGRGSNRGFRYRQFPPGMFDPVSQEVQSGGPPQYPRSPHVQPTRPPSASRHQASPTLAADCWRSAPIGGKTYLCGCNGLVILASGGERASRFPDLTATVNVDTETTLEAQAKEVTLIIHSPDDLKRELQVPNPYLRARARGTAWNTIRLRGEDYLPVMRPCVHDRHAHVRAAVVVLLDMMPDEAAIGLLNEATRDADSAIRMAAGLALARRGRLPPVALIREMLEQRRSEVIRLSDTAFGIVVEKSAGL